MDSVTGIWESRSVGRGPGQSSEAQGPEKALHPQEILPFSHLCCPFPLLGLPSPGPLRRGDFFFQSLVGGGVPQKTPPPRASLWKQKAWGRPLPLCRLLTATASPRDSGLSLSLLKPTVYKSITSVSETTKEVKLSGPVPEIGGQLPERSSPALCPLPTSPSEGPQGGPRTSMGGWLAPRPLQSGSCGQPGIAGLRLPNEL